MESYVKIPDAKMLNEFQRRFEVNDDGVVRYKIDVNKNVKAGDRVGALRVGINRNNWSLSRIVWFLRTGYYPNPYEEVMRKNYDHYDLSINNLTLACVSEVRTHLHNGIYGDKNVRTR